MALSEPMEKPSLLNLLMEGRAVFEWASYFALRPWLDDSPQGDGHPVLVLPGLMTSDLTMTPMRSLISDLGFKAYPWEQGMNTGPCPNVLEALSQRIDELHAKYEKPVSLVGWSMGGAMAVALTHYQPQKIRNVITLGSPLSGNPEHSSISGVFEMISGMTINENEMREILAGDPRVPVSSLVSKGDGVVSWTAGIMEGPKRETIIIKTASHLGLPVHPAALMVVADRLQQSRRKWRKFTPPEGVLKWMATHHVKEDEVMSEKEAKKPAVEALLKRRKP